MRTPRSAPLLRLFLASLLFLGLGALTTVCAQDIDEDAPSDEPVAEEPGAGFFAVGAQFTDLARLNDRLSGAGYPTFASEMVSLGGGGYGLFNLGYLFRPASGLRVYPLLGLGVRAGYMISALSSDWQLGNSSLAGGPDASMQGPFLRLTIGGIDSPDDDD